MPHCMPHVTIVLVNWNNYEDTTNCLESIQNLDYEPIDIILVDNNSTDDSGVRLKAENPDIETILHDENGGFGAGNNVAINRAIEDDTDYVWVLNNDVLIPEESAEVLSNLVDIMESQEGVGILTPTVMQYPRTDEVWFERGYIDERSANAGHSSDRKRFVDLRLGLGPEASDESHIIWNEYVPFCSALIRAEVFDEVGLFPEDYFMYYGDVDYCIRVRDAGYKIGTVQACNVYHRVSSSSTTSRSPLHYYYLARNRQLLVRKHRSKFSWAFPLLYLWWVSLNIIYCILQRDEEGLHALLMGAIDGIRGRSGRGRFP